LFSCNVLYSLSLSFCHFGVRWVNTTRNNRLVGSYVLNKRAKFDAKNIHAFLKNCGFRVGAFYFDAPVDCVYRIFSTWEVISSSQSDTEVDVQVTVASRRLNWRSGQALSLPPFLFLPSFPFSFLPTFSYLSLLSSPLPYLPLALRSRPLYCG